MATRLTVQFNDAPSMKPGKGEVEKEKAKTGDIQHKKESTGGSSPKDPNASVERDCDGLQHKTREHRSDWGTESQPHTVQQVQCIVRRQDTDASERERHNDVTTMITDGVNNKGSRNDLGRGKAKGRKGRRNENGAGQWRGRAHQAKNAIRLQRGYRTIRWSFNDQLRRPFHARELLRDSLPNHPHPEHE